MEMQEIQEEEKTDTPIPAKKRKSSILFLLIISQILSIAGILYFFIPGKHQEAKPSAQSPLLWDIWEKLGDEALQEGNPDQGIYFLEKVYKELPLDSDRRMILEQKLAKLYYQSRKNKAEKQKLSSFGENIPEKYALAESSYQKGEYQKAYTLFYEYLLQSEENKNNEALTSKAYLRIQQCQIQIFLAKLPAQEDELILESLKILKK